MDNVKLTSQEHWQTTWETTGAPTGFELLDDLAPHLPPTAGLNFFEVGCAPGRISVEFCKRFGYVAHGIDYAEDPREIEAFLRGAGARVGKIYREDFLTWETDQRYDIVASFGFIEHFADAAQVVDRHFELTRPGGLVVITVPNFARGQKALHWLFDRDNLRLHNTRCMNLKFFRDAAGRNGARLLEARYAGGHYDFWVGGDPKLSWLGNRVMWRTTALLKKVNDSLPAGVNPWFSPFIIAVYRVPGGGGD